MKFLSPRVHGMVDYVFAAVFLVAPWVFNFSALPAVICAVLAAVHFTLALCTVYPVGAVRVIPFAAHGWFELFAGIGLLLAPWIFGFAGGETTARDFFVGAGAALLLVWVGTDYQRGHEME